MVGGSTKKEKKNFQGTGVGRVRGYFLEQHAIREGFKPCLANVLAVIME